MPAISDSLRREHESAGPITVRRMEYLQRRSAASAGCSHLPSNVPVPTSDHCPGCGSRFNLRLCATCGHVGCCESQAGHARAHALTEGHPVIYQMPAPDGFVWCYSDDLYIR